MNYAQVQNGKVVNIVLADESWVSAQESPEEWIPYTLTKPAIMYGDYINGMFYPPQPYPSWVLNEQLFIWEAPIKRPTGDLGYAYIWDEEKLQWVHNPSLWNFNEETGEWTIKPGYVPNPAFEIRKPVY